ncbi:GHMP kinase [Flavobacterium silvisoli]|uniref:GHMP kinase n=1 Tax=Flavobacterium silvisoli TaxID=2529433 RepID=A0A4Q9Z2K8_9FLAO|nr:GYDIA family GHMP kinase [Flavobacterium silvisoli]TBX70612.1 GHMP kinase [Flavobacterium silvisoli]
MKKTFYSNGKLLITGEYVVLDGAKAFALPTKYGQNLKVEEAEGNLIHWTSFDSDGSIWFKETIPFSSVVRKERFDAVHDIKNTLIEILHEAYLIDSDFITEGKGYNITTELTFPKKWGLGTSSTLINNIAQWLKLDAFELLRKSFGGSGYDIACAQNNSGIIYQLIDDKPVVKLVDFHPDFTDKIFFVYLNKKQNSRKAITSYFGKNHHIYKSIPVIDALTQTVVTATEPKTFALALQRHEIELSNILELATVKETLFEDFDGVVKSLGAWGGDFVLSISKDDPTEYFRAKGYETVIPYKDMIAEI